MKKKIEVTIKCNDEDVFNKYFASDFNKIVSKRMFLK